MPHVAIEHHQPTPPPARHGRRPRRDLRTWPARTADRTIHLPSERRAGVERDEGERDDGERGSGRVGVREPRRAGPPSIASS
ncbi:hypothetical protein HD597_012573 [Nonomuraea thailandensis]|uniref:Uncharacterized protein n=1 Tax=Nonomuraea thailandensis TaxID=1188745 RepID=A0A9X2H2V0_9ACTN|nr:hypothetical protein [Nonomuraea thailandensis]MCP2365553.1 hypothetical protein [Nonomuraea thailandensis]